MSYIEHLTRRLPAQWPHLALLAIVSLSLNLYGITWGLPNTGDWTNMSLAPLKPLSFAKHLLDQEPWLFHYPPFHFVVLALVYSPYVLYLVATGGLGSPTDTFPFGLAEPEASLTVFILLARLTSVVMATGLVLVNYLTVRRFYGARAAFVSSLLIASSYPIIHFAHNANVDVPYLFWLSLALYSFVRLIEAPQTRWYLLLALFTALAVGTKHTAYALAVGLIPTVLYVHYRSVADQRPGTTFVSAFLDRRLVYAAGLFGVALIVIFNPILNWEGFTAHLARHAGRSIGGSWVVQTASGSLRGHVVLAGQYLDYIRQSNGLPAFVLLVTGFLYCLVRYPKPSLIITLPIVTYYLLYLRTFGTHHLRYVLPVYLLCTWQAGKLASDLTGVRAIPRPVSQVVVGLILGSALLYGFTVDFLYVRDPRYAAEQWIADHVPPAARVLALEPVYSLPRLPTTIAVTYRNLWDFNGNRIADITDVPADYIVVGMSIPRRSGTEKWKVDWVKTIDVDGFLTERGYRPVASFKTPLPPWGAEVPDIHVINPRVVIWKTVEERRPTTSQASVPARAGH
jgi:4-amino-4-deoxy-L-arabinose transferase-like glycosyltransferase